MSIDEIFVIESLPKLATHLEKGNVAKTRSALLSRFFALVEYRNAREWNELVRV